MQPAGSAMYMCVVYCLRAAPRLRPHWSLSLVSIERKVRNASLLILAFGPLRALRWVETGLKCQQWM